MIQFAHPLALLSLVAIPILLALHLLRPRRRRVVVSTTTLWQAALREREHEDPLRTGHDEFRPGTGGGGAPRGRAAARRTHARHDERTPGRATHRLRIRRR